MGVLLRVGFFAWERAKEEDRNVDDETNPEERLEEQGFTVLDEDEFENQQVDREYCWRRAFTFTEVHEEIPIERQYLTDDRPAVTDRIREELEGGGAVKLLGEPGAGKTTTTRQVASHWYDDADTGPVVYRHDQTRAAEQNLDEIVDAIETFAEEEPVLVVLEDAARPGTAPFYEVLHELQGDDDVSFLLNSRENEWKSFEDRLRGHDRLDPSTNYGEAVLTTRNNYPTRVEMPGLDEDEVERLLDRYVEETDREVQGNPDEILAQISTERGVSPMLLLSYHLPIGAGSGDADGHDSALHKNVADVHGEITDPDRAEWPVDLDEDADLLGDVALLVNVLNAAEIPVYPEYVHALGDDRSEHRAIDQVLVAFDGLLFFGQDADDQYWSHHPIWSELYLQRHLDETASEHDARTRFERCVNALFELLDSEDRREDVREYLARDTPRLQAHDDQPTVLADAFVRALFEVGESRPPLAPLFGSTAHSGVDVPDACSPFRAVACSLARARMVRVLGDRTQTEAELRAAEDVANETDAPRSTTAAIATERGHVARALGDYEKATDHYERSLDIAQELDNRAGEATSLGNLGNVAFRQGDYDQAREYYEQSLAIQRDLGDRAGEAASLDNLGLVARKEGDYDQAEEYHAQSLAIERDLGDRAGEATSLNNLGKVAFRQGDYDQAEEYHAQSLAIKRDLGDRAGEANSLNNLANVAFRQGDYDQAREYYEGAAGIFSEIGAVRNLLKAYRNVVNVCEALNDQAAAVEWCERALAVIEETDIPGLDARRREFEIDRLRLDDGSANTRQLYRLALEAIHQADAETAVDALAAAWTTGERVAADTDQYALCLRAGAGLAAHLDAFDTDDAEDRLDAIHSTLADHRDRLSPAATALYERVADGTTDADPDDLLAAVGLDPDDELDLDELDLDELEAVAYATLLGLLRNRDDD